jgi:hypothetical protein
MGHNRTCKRANNAVQAEKTREQRSDDKREQEREQLCSIYYGKEGAAQSASDVDPYVIIWKSLDSTYVLPEFIRRWEMQAYTGLFFRKVTYTRYDVP